jgi:ribosomal protein S18 acetylase RimI-like enzyme
MPLLNGVFSVARRPDAAEVADLATSPRLAVLPWSLQVRGDRVDPAIEEIAAGHGLRQRSSVQFMLRDLTDADAAPPPADAPRVRAVSGDEKDLYRHLLAAGAEGPPELFDVFVAPALMNHPDMRGYVTEAAGEPVATSFGVLVGDTVGVFNVTVPPRHRRRGYGRAATRAVLRDARAAGARTAFLHATPLGIPLYETMGFRTAENWTAFTP